MKKDKHPESEFCYPEDTDLSCLHNRNIDKKNKVYTYKQM